MNRIQILFEIDRITAFGHEDEEKLLPSYYEIDPMPSVPRVGDWINSDMLPIPETCSFFLDRDWAVKYVDWRKDDKGYYTVLYVQPQ